VFKINPVETLVIKPELLEIFNTLLTFGYYELPYEHNLYMYLYRKLENSMTFGIHKKGNKIILYRKRIPLGFTKKFTNNKIKIEIW